MPTEHALLSASSSERWLHCPPLARLEAYEPNKSSSFAEEGTYAHELAELKLRYKTGKITSSEYESEYLIFTEHSTYYNEEMEHETDKFVDYVMARAAEHETSDSKPDVHIEQRVKFDRWVPEGFGTADAVIATDGIIEIVDLKYGKGIKVSAEQNSQIMLYALGVYAAFDLVYEFDRVRMTIHQPRLDHVDTFEISIDELLYWADFYVQPRAQQAWLGVGEYNFKPGILRFSPVKGTLRERAKRVVELVEEFEYKSGELLTDRELSEALAHADEAEAWAKDIKAYATEQMQQGKKVDGFKLVEGRGKRVITDPETLVERLDGEGFGDVWKPRALKTLTEFEKEFGKKPFKALAGDLITKEPGKPKLAAADAKGKEWLPVAAAEDDFGDWDEVNE